MARDRGLLVTDVLKPEWIFKTNNNFKYKKNSKQEKYFRTKRMTRERLPKELEMLPNPEDNENLTLDDIKEVADVVTELKIRTGKFVDSKVNILLAALRQGVPPERACKMAGISIATFMNWKQRGEKGIEPFKSFINVLDQIRIELEEWCLAAIKHAADPNKRFKTITKTTGPKGDTETIVEKPANYDWKAAVWLLENLCPEDYSKKKEEQTSINTTNNVIIQLPSNGRDEINKIKEINPPKEEIKRTSIPEKVRKGLNMKKTR